MKVFDTLATENEVSGVTGTPAATSASPAVPRQIDPSAKTIAAETPGRPYFARRRARRASRTSASIGVALGVPSRLGQAVTSGPGVEPAGGWLGTLGSGDRVDVGRADAVVGAAVAPGPAVDIGAVVLPDDAISATGPSDGAKRGDMSQPPTATLATTRATRTRREARFTRMGEASCRQHHSASRSPVPSADDPAR